MKRLLSALVTAVLVLGPVSAEAKPSKSCIGVVTVEYKAGKKIVDRRAACAGKVRPLPKTATWSSANRIDWD